MNWKERVLVLAPHADDETIGCGGMIATLRETERPVKVIIAEADRIRDSMGESLSPGRHAELVAAMNALGVQDFCYLNSHGRRPDALEYRNTIAKLDGVIFEYDPTSVFIPYPSHHQDHKRLYEAALAALRPRHRRRPPALVAAYEYPYIDTWPSPALQAGRFIMDITDAWERKEKAMAAYASQIGPDRYLSIERVEDHALRHGEEIGCQYGEAFYLLRGRLF